MWAPSEEENTVFFKYEKPAKNYCVEGNAEQIKILLKKAHFFYIQ